jgi:hypothetical protein
MKGLSVSWLLSCLAQYKKKKQADLTSEPNTNTGQVDNNVS